MCDVPVPNYQSILCSAAQRISPARGIGWACVVTSCSGACEKMSIGGPEGVSRSTVRPSLIAWSHAGGSLGMHAVPLNPSQDECDMMMCNLTGRTGVERSGGGGSMEGRMLAPYEHEVSE